MRGLDQVVISKDSKTAAIGGGVRVKKVIESLWAAGKDTSS
jgi:hypothetical protein